MMIKKGGDERNFVEHLGDLLLHWITWLTQPERKKGWGTFRIIK